MEWELYFTIYLGILPLVFSLNGHIARAMFDICKAWCDMMEEAHQRSVTGTIMYIVLPNSLFLLVPCHLLAILSAPSVLPYLLILMFLLLTLTPMALFLLQPSDFARKWAQEKANIEYWVATPTRRALITCVWTLPVATWLYALAQVQKSMFMILIHVVLQ